MARRTFTLCVPLALISGSGSTAHSHSHLLSSSTWTIQHILYGTSLEEHLETAVGPECSDTESNITIIDNSCNMSSIGYQKASRYNSSPLWLQAKLTLGPPISVGFYSSRQAWQNLQALWVKQSHLVHLRKHALSNMRYTDSYFSSGLSEGCEDKPLSLEC